MFRLHSHRHNFFHHRHEAGGVLRILPGCWLIHLTASRSRLMIAGMSELRALLKQVADGVLSVDDAVTAVRSGTEKDLGFAKADLARAKRCGTPEVIYSAGKTPEQVRELVRALHEDGSPVLATRATPSHFEAVHEQFPGAIHHEVARVITVPGATVPEPHGRIAVVCAGTSDLPVAEEAAVTAEFLGARVERFTDVGVAGVHRLVNRLDAIRKAHVVVAVAGMEGALPSVLGGLIDRPMIAVPTSVGYGMSLNGLAALLAMLNSCAPGISVVNVDNGFGAAVAAHLINRLAGGPGPTGDTRTPTPD